jgi:hypothetical protein
MRGSKKMSESSFDEAVMSSVVSSPDNNIGRSITLGAYMELSAELYQKCLVRYEARSGKYGLDGSAAPGAELSIARLVDWRRAYRKGRATVAEWWAAILEADETCWAFVEHYRWKPIHRMTAAFASVWLEAIQEDWLQPKEAQS